MGRDWSGRTRDAEHAASQAWDELVATIEQAGEAARSMSRRTRNLADEAGSRFGSATDEARTRAKRARTRAKRAKDALAGRPAPLPWAWIAGATVAGAALGWFAGTAARRAAARDALALEDEPVLPAAPTDS